MAKDRREDAGQFYPGGSVVPRGPVTPGGGGTPADYGTVRQNAATGAAHAADATPHVTEAQKAEWSAKQDRLTDEQLANINDMPNKRDKGDLAVYKKVGVGNDWKFEVSGETEEGVAELSELLENGQYSLTNPYGNGWVMEDVPGFDDAHQYYGDENSVSVGPYAFNKQGTDLWFKVVATRGHDFDYVSPPDSLAKTSDLTQKRDLANNICTKDEHDALWTSEDLPSDIGTSQPYFDEAETAQYWVWFGSNDIYTANGPRDATELTFGNSRTTFAATRKALAKSGESYLTSKGIEDKRDKTDNTCHKSEFSEWGSLPIGVDSIEWQGDGWQPFQAGTPIGSTKGDANSVELTWIGGVDWMGDTFTATRKAPAKSGESYVTQTGVRNIVKTDAETRNAISGLAEAAVDDKLPIALEAKTASFTAEDGKRYTVAAMPATLAVTLPDYAGDAANVAHIFEARFDGSALTADASVTFDGGTATTMATDCGTVKAGKIALMSAFWNGATWDVSWKNQG